MGLPICFQPDEMDCGSICLRIITKHYGRTINLEKLIKLSEITIEGSSLRNIADSAKKIGFRVFVWINRSNLCHQNRSCCAT